MTTLPVFAYYSYAQPGVPPQNGLDRAWAAALTLIIIVAILFTVARVLARILQAEGTPMSTSDDDGRRPYADGPID